MGRFLINDARWMFSLSSRNWLRWLSAARVMCEKSRAINTWANSARILEVDRFAMCAIFTLGCQLHKYKFLFLSFFGKFRLDFCRYLLVSPGSSSENIRNPLFMSFVRGAKMVDVTLVTLWGLWRKIFAVADWARDLSGIFGEAVIGFLSSCESVFGEKIMGWAKIAAVTDRGRWLTISQLFTLMVFIGLMVICSPLSSISFLLFASSTITTLATLLLPPIVAFTSTFFCFKSLIPSTMLSRLITLMSVRVALGALASTTFDSSCCASSWAHDKISCSFSIPLELHKIVYDNVLSELSQHRARTRRWESPNEE